MIVLGDFCNVSFWVGVVVFGELCWVLCCFNMFGFSFGNGLCNGIGFYIMKVFRGIDDVWKW